MRHSVLQSATWAFLVTAAFVTPQALVSQEALGSIDFPTSGSPAAQEHFIQGALFLHSFEYESAARAFREAQRLDPDFAMAYWGEAMTYTHPVWNEKDTDAARATLQRLGSTPAARRAKAPTQREAAYLEAVEILYGDGSKEELDTLYSQAMERLARSYPDDLEARAFYALSLLGLTQGNRDIPTYMQAGAIAQQVFDQNRGHPGGAHYLIHSFDDPIHAPLGLTAARAYSKIAPGAAHAQHMTSHIFVAMGMWDDVVVANVNATSVVNTALARRERPSYRCGHYNEWLHYGYLQQGRYEDAAALLGACYEDQESQTWRRVNNFRDPRASFVFMRAGSIVDTRSWDGEAAHANVTTDGIRSWAQMFDHFGTGYAAIHRNDRVAGERALSEMETLASAMSHEVLGNTQIMMSILTALLLRSDGEAERAIAELRQAADLEEQLPFEFGPPRTIKPPRELLGEMLLDIDRPHEAFTEFQLALARTPERALALLGAARAAAAAGETDKATDAYSALAEIWHRADPGRPELIEAREFLAASAAAGDGGKAGRR